MTRSSSRAFAVLPRATFQRALSAVCQAVQRKCPIPSLSAVRLEVTDRELIFTGTGNGLSVRVFAHAEVSNQAEQLMLPAHRLEAYVRLLDAQTITLQNPDARRATVGCGASSTTLATVPSIDFPFVPDAPLNSEVTVEQSRLARALRHTAFAVAQDGKQPQLRGALIESSPSQVRLVTTDGHRLSLYEVPAASRTWRAFMPEALLLALERLIEKSSEEPCSLSATDTSVFACIPGEESTLQLSHRLVSGQFPKYHSILPDKADASVRVGVAQFHSAIRRCLTITPSKSGIVTLTVSPANLRVSAAEASTGEVNELIQAISSFRFPTFTAMFRGDYLLDVLERLVDEVTLGFFKIGGTHGLWIIAEPVEGERFEHVLMGLKS